MITLNQKRGENINRMYTIMDYLYFTDEVFKDNETFDVVNEDHSEVKIEKRCIQ